MNRRNFISRAGLFAAFAIGACCFTGCGVSDILNEISSIVTAAQKVLPTLTGVPANIIALVNPYLTLVATAASKASDILAQGLPTADMILQVVSAFTGIVAPLIPPPFSIIATAVGVVASYVATLLGKQTGQLAAHSAVSVRVKVSSGDLKRIATIKEHAALILAATK